MTSLARGENRPVPADQMTITVASPSSVDVSALLLGRDGRVRSDLDLVFFNNPVGPGVTYLHGRGAGDVVQVDTRALPADVDTVAVTASLDGSGPPTFSSAGSLVATVHAGTAAEPSAMTFEMTGLSTESAVVCIEIYRRADAWKVRAVGQGYDEGLAGIATAFGIDIEDHDEPAAPPPTAPTPPPAPSAPPTPPPPPQQGAPPMRSDLFDASHAEVTGQGIQKQGGKMCKVAMNGEVMARAGSMVPYQGDLRF